MPKSRLLEATDRLARAVVDDDKNAALRALVDVREAAEEISQLQPVVHSGILGRTMQVTKDEIPKRRGQQLTNTKLPMGRASINSGMSIYAIAKSLSVSYSTVKSWGVKSLPPDEIRKILARKPYLVPESSWKL